MDLNSSAGRYYFAEGVFLQTRYVENHMKTEEKQLFEDLATHFDIWVEAVMGSISKSNSDLIWTDSPESFQRVRDVVFENNLENEMRQILKESFQGILHSVLVTFDGGTALAEKFLISIVSENGHVFDRNLHEEFIEYLIETGRLK